MPPLAYLRVQRNAEGLITDRGGGGATITGSGAVVYGIGFSPDGAVRPSTGGIVRFVAPASGIIPGDRRLSWICRDSASAFCRALSCCLSKTAASLTRACAIASIPRFSAASIDALVMASYIGVGVVCNGQFCIGSCCLMIVSRTFWNCVSAGVVVFSSCNARCRARLTPLTAVCQLIGAGPPASNPLLSESGRYW